MTSALAHTQTGYLNGKLLIASPLIGDPRFDRTVIYVCSHDAETAMGIILNRPVTGLRLPDLLEQLDVSGGKHAQDAPVLEGGPVDRDRGFVLHTLDVDCGPATERVGTDLGLTATQEILNALASDKAPAHALMALGYAGWGAGQLEDEISLNAWLVADADHGLIFDDQPDEKWARALSKLGVTPEFLTASSGSA
ncbi:YqgE/AlgH family protein [Oceanicaulis sp. MMSF_3324]|uniref:YqgE/AlgH family protein n=1 Tax=Oceanicaulis sp. MMSF_3324 TaxID=3046702 RepID=UPI00273EEDAA|nr:YqgE/AlgH family protein [Oceanicaulis sp. MMSF_3324]